MPACAKCVEIRKLKTPVVSGAGKYPSILELAYMVNLEYYLEMQYFCSHEIPEDKSAKIPIKEMVDFLDAKKWQLGTRTKYLGNATVLVTL
jgi:hypothetical protein